MDTDETPNTIFQVPQQFLDKLHDLSGGAKEHKGFVLFMLNEDCEPITIVSPKTKSGTIFSLAKSAEIWLENFNQSHTLNRFED